MSNPLFYASSMEIRVDTTVDDWALYFRIKADMQAAGDTNVMFGRAPTEIAATYGLTLYVNEDGDPMIPGVHVNTFPAVVPVVIVTGPGFLQGIAVGLSEPSGTFHNINVPDANGVIHPDADWRWQCDLLGLTQTVPPSLDGKWQQQVVTWTGDGVNGRLIPTTFPLNSGNVLVWVMAETAGSWFRHNAMSGTTMGTSPILAPANGGIVSFEAAGFTVKDYLPLNCRVNILGSQYTAVIMRETTSNHSVMSFGSYTGTDSITPPAGEVTTDFSLLFPTKAPTQTWIFGRSGQMVFCADDFAAGDAVSIDFEAKAVTGGAQMRGYSSLGTFFIGLDNNVNSHLLVYYWVAFLIPVGSPIRNHFSTFKVTGTGSVIQVPTTNYTASFAIARPFTAAVPQSVRRTPWQAGTNSTRWDLTNIPTGGIRAFNLNSFDLGTVVASTGMDVYGFAMDGYADVDVFTPPVYEPIDPPGGGGGGGGVGGGGGDGGGHDPRNGDTGCTSVVSPGTGNAGTPGCSY